MGRSWQRGSSTSSVTTTRSTRSACTASAVSWARTAASSCKPEGLTTVVNSGVVSFILLKVIDMVMGIRVTEEEEQGGLDVVLQGEVVV
jgi:ammonia channel protein AmtB